MGIIIAAVLAVVLLAAIGMAAFSRLKKVPPNRADVIVGMKDRGAVGSSQTERVAKMGDDGRPLRDDNGDVVFEAQEVSKFSTARVVIGDRYFLLPFLYDVTSISLEQRSAEFTVRAPAKGYVDTEVRVNVQFRVGNDPNSVRRAAARFKDQQDEIPTIIADAMAGHIRAVIGQITVPQLIEDREAFKTSILEAVEADFLIQGIVIDTLNVNEVLTPGSTYLEDLAKVELAGKRQSAELADQNAQLEIAKNAARTEQQAADAQRELDINRAEYEKQTESAKIESATAPKLLQAEKDRLIAEEERAAAEVKARTTEAELLSTVVKPAEAKAQADLEARKRDAEARAFETTRAADAAKDAAASKAESVRVAAEADAAAIQAKGEAEAAAVSAAADAAARYDENAIRVKLLEVLPQLVREAAAPMGNIDDLTVISTDGANKLSKGTMETVTSLTPFLDKVGIDLGSLLGTGASETKSGAASLD